VKPVRTNRSVADALSEDVGPWPVRRMRDRDTTEEFGAAVRMAGSLGCLALLAILAIVAGTAILGAGEGAGLPRAHRSPSPSPAPTPQYGWPGETIVPFTFPPSPAPSPSAIAAATPGPLRGWATWCAPTPTHCESWGGGRLVGAVRSFSDGDAPYFVQVCGFEGGRTSCVHILVVSHCACGDRDGIPTVIDLSPAAFAELAPLERGRIRVEVSGPIKVGLPNTDTLESLP
jgi:hypothetical protein